MSDTLPATTAENHGYRISASIERDKLQINFEDNDFGARALLHIERCGSRRDENNKPLYWVFTPSVEGKIHAAIASQIQKDAAAIIFAARQREIWNERCAMAEKRAKRLDGIIARRPVNIEIGTLHWPAPANSWLGVEYLKMPEPTWPRRTVTSKGVDELLESVGAWFYRKGIVRMWLFNRHQRQAIDEILPELKRLFAEHREEENARPTYYVWGDDDIVCCPETGAASIMGQVVDFEEYEETQVHETKSAELEDFC